MIEFNGVKKVYPGGFVALEDVNLTIDKGEFVFVLGHSGAGKSTFLKLILREETTTEGSVTVNGYNLQKIKERKIPYMRRGLGVVFQDFRLIPTMTSYENVAFAMRVTNIPEKEIKTRVPFVLNLVGLKDKANSLPAEMSGGEQQRVALARALVHSPPIIIADEPTGNIDPELSVEIMELLAAINSVGITVVVVTHEHELAARFNKRVIQIEDGHLVADSKNGDVILTDPSAWTSDEAISNITSAAALGGKGGSI
ncbi:MAG: cell division ATP-binding protein FtsE [Oscillospiraceae bacterium]